jgi:hypothetical protein
MAGQDPLSAAVAAGGRLGESGGAVLQLLFQYEGEEAARDVAANGLVEFVKDRPRGEQALGRAERPFHHPQILVAKHRFERREICNRPAAAALLAGTAVAKGVTLGLALRSRRDGWEGSRGRAPTALEQGREVADR